MKDDTSRHSVVLAAIKRKTDAPYDFKWTRLYNSNSDFASVEIELVLQEYELIICSVIIDSSNYSILTTRRLVTVVDNIDSSCALVGAKDKGYGDFKGYLDDSITFGSIECTDGTNLKYFIETGAASRAMIYGVRTSIQLRKALTS